MIEWFALSVLIERAEPNELKLESDRDGAGCGAHQWVHDGRSLFCAEGADDAARVELDRSPRPRA